MHHFRIPAVCVATLALLMAIVPAQASVLGTYNDRTTWEGLTSGRTDIDFTSLGLSPGAAANYSTAAGLTIGSANFTSGYGGTSYQLYGLNPTAGTPEDWDSGTLLAGPSWATGAYFQVVLSGGVTSFGLDLMSAYPAGATFRILLDGIDLGITIVTGTRPNRTFFGVRTDIPFSTVRVIFDSSTPFGPQALFDNFAFGLAAGDPPPGGETPEITTLLYIGSGVGLMQWAKRRRALGAAAA